MRYINPRTHLVTNRTLMTARVVIAKYVCIGSCSRVVVSTSNSTISPLPPERLWNIVSSVRKSGDVVFCAVVRPLLAATEHAVDDGDVLAYPLSAGGVSRARDALSWARRSFDLQIVAHTLARPANEPISLDRVSLPPMHIPTEAVVIEWMRAWVLALPPPRLN